MSGWISRRDRARVLDALADSYGLGYYPYRIPDALELRGLSGLTWREVARELRTIGEELGVLGFYDTHQWRRVRYDALEASGGVCACCGARGGDVQLHVDHIVPRSLDPSRALDPANLQVLCSDCNLGKGNRHQTDWRAA